MSWDGTGISTNALWNKAISFREPRILVNLLTRGGYFDARLISRLEARRQRVDGWPLLTGVAVEELVVWVPAVDVGRADVTVGDIGEIFPPSPKLTGGGPGMEKLPKSLYILGHETPEYRPGIETRSLSEGCFVPAPLTLTCLRRLKWPNYHQVEKNDIQAAGIELRRYWM